MPELNAQLCECSSISGSVRVSVESRLELIQFPNFEILQIAKHCHISRQFGVRPQQRMNKQSPLCIHLSKLTPETGAIKEFSYRCIHCPARLQFFFNRQPLAHWIEPSTFTGQARYVKIWPIMLIDIATVS